MQEAKEEVRARLNIEDVVGEYVQLKRAGRNFKGLSPFTNERTPSFTVSPEKHIWHDFSSGKGGDIFSFVMEVEGLEFREALEKLARKAGVELSQFDSKKAGEIAARKKRLTEANELACRYYQQCLLREKSALEYVFATRKLSKKVVQEFRIGYAPQGGDALVRALHKRGFSDQELRQAGLVNRFGGDLFRGRMTVPLMDAAGQVVGFTGRILRNEPNAPKYLNTPATLLYDKSRHVFGLSQAKQAIRTTDQAVIVEGNLDVVSSHQAEVAYVVATAGTAMTEQHLKALSRLSQTIKLAFDGDKAGIAATERAIPLAQRVGVDLLIVSLPNGAKDPDELIQHSPADWVTAIDSAEPVVDWVLKQYAQREDLTTAAGKRAYTTAAATVVRALDDSVEQEHYLSLIAKTIDTSVASLRQKLARGAEQAAPQLKTIKSTSLEQSRPSYHDDILAMLLAAPPARQLLDQATIAHFPSAEQRRLADYFLRHHQPLPEPLPKELQSIDTYVKIVQLKVEERYASWQASELELHAAHLLRRMQIEHKKQTLHTITQQLRDAEDNGDERLAGELRKQVATLIKETA